MNHIPRQFFIYNMSNLKPKVLLGMSGGVDSSVSAALLLEQGYEVIGAFMKNWSREKGAEEGKNGFVFGECDWKGERRDAMRVASQLGIPFVTFDFEEEYRRDVVDYMFREFQAGRTPNPDVMCNKFVKFDLFLKEADRLGCQFIATGHYARTDGGRILAGVDPNKDQTYFLWAINPSVLPRVLFPVGAMTKPEVRKKAEELGLSTAQKKDSVGICFVGEVDIREFLMDRIPKTPGQIVTTEGTPVGEHDGLAFYTIGQRHGLNVGGGTPYYVVEKRPETNTLVVSSNYHPKLFEKTLTAGQLNWFRKPTSFPYACQARIRYRQPLASCRVSLPLSKGELEGVRSGVFVEFDDPQRAVTPGQSIVFYDGEEMIGGGIIE